MSAFIRTAPTATGSPALPLPSFFTTKHHRTGRPTDGAAAAREADRFVRFWASYDADPDSVTAWKDAAAAAWRGRPLAHLRAASVESVDRWNGEGGSDPDEA